MRFSTNECGPPWSVNNEMGYSEHQELDFMCCPNMKPSNMPWEDRVLQWQLETRVHILASWEPHQSLSFLWYISPQDLEQQLKKKVLHWLQNRNCREQRTNSPISLLRMLLRGQIKLKPTPAVVVWICLAQRFALFESVALLEEVCQCGCGL